MLDLAFIRGRCGLFLAIRNQSNIRFYENSKDVAENNLRYFNVSDVCIFSEELLNSVPDY